jgi:hypothetical protein
MADDLKNRGGTGSQPGEHPRGSRGPLLNPEVGGLTKGELIEAVSKAGVSVDAARRSLGRHSA